MNVRILTVVLCLVVAACGGETLSQVSPSPLGGSGSPSSSSATPGTTSSVTPVPGRLAFSSDRDGSRAIYVATGLDIRKLAQGDQPKWSPNGTQLVFQAASPSLGIFVINADGSGQRLIAEGFRPSWSADGTRIVFAYGDVTGSGLYVINADGTNRTKIADSTFDVTSAIWSPDGRTIAFVLASYDFPWHIQLMNPDGTSIRPLYHPSGGMYTQDEPEWSPDGTQLVFQTSNGIAISNADGSTSQTVASGRTLSPDWIPGGFVYCRYTGPGPTLLGGWEHRIFALEHGTERQVIADVDTGRKYMDSAPDWTR